MKLLGIAIIGAVLLALFAGYVAAYGFWQALFGWGVGIALTALICLGAWLIAEGS